MQGRSAFLIIHRLSTLGNCHIRIAVEMILAEFRCVRKGDAVVLFDRLARLSNSIPCQRVA